MTPEVNSELILRAPVVCASLRLPCCRLLYLILFFFVVVQESFCGFHDGLWQPLWRGCVASETRIYIICTYFRSESSKKSRVSTSQSQSMSHIPSGDTIVFHRKPNSIIEWLHLSLRFYVDQMTWPFNGNDSVTHDANIYQFEIYIFLIWVRETFDISVFFRLFVICCCFNLS